MPDKLFGRCRPTKSGRKRPFSRSKCSKMRSALLIEPWRSVIVSQAPFPMPRVIVFVSGSYLVYNAGSVSRPGFGTVTLIGAVRLFQGAVVAPGDDGRG